MKRLLILLSCIAALWLTPREFAEPPAEKATRKVAERIVPEKVPDKAAEPAAKKAAPLAIRAQMERRFRELGLAMHSYHDTNGHFPTAVSFDKEDKKTRLSWRVHLLPYLELGALYAEFHLEEPWDSEHNKKLIAKLPPIYRPANPKLAAAGKTKIVAPAGEETLFPNKNQAIRLADITDGTSNTIMLIEADDDHAVVWTKPDDLEIDLKKPLAGLEIQTGDGFVALFADGAVHVVRKTIDTANLAALFTRAGGEVAVLKPRDEIALRPAPAKAAPAVKGVPAKAPPPAPAAAPAARVQVSNRLRTLGRAMHKYHDVNGHFPTAVSFDKEGKKTRLSWRVHLLPYIPATGPALYKEFHLDEPWDSEHNKTLIPKLPPIYKSVPANPKLVAAGKTKIVAPLGEGTIFPNKNEATDIAHITDGTSNTIMLIEADDDHAVVWTKPDDLEIDLKKPLAGLELQPGDAFLALFADGSVHCLRKTIDTKTLAALFTRAGGEVVEVVELKPLDELALRPAAPANAAPVLPPEEAFIKQFEQQFGPQYRSLYRSELQFLRLVCQPTKEQNTKIVADGEKAYKALVKTYAGFLRDQQQGRWDNGEKHDPRRQIDDALLRSVRTHLPVEQGARYAEEMRERNAASRRVTLSTLVVMVDRVLILSAEQRVQLTEILDQNWNDGWPLFISRSGFYFPVMPDAKINPILTETQKSVWKGVQKGNIHFGLWLNFVAQVQADDDPDDKPPAEQAKPAKEEKAAPKQAPKKEEKTVEKKAEKKQAPKKAEKAAEQKQEKAEKK
jgi:hypothetical protein